MPCSGTSRPAVSASSSTRMPPERFIVQRQPNEAENVSAPTGGQAEQLHARPGAASPCRRSPPWPVCERVPRAPGTANRPVATRAPDARHAVDGDRADRVVDADPLDRRARRRRRSTPETRPITTAAQGATKPDAAVTADERGEHAVQHHRDVRLAQHEPGGDATPLSAAGRRGEVRRQRDVGEEADLVAGDDAERRARG